MSKTGYKNFRSISEAKLMKLEAHPLASILPMASDEEIQSIGRDIAQRGYRQDRPIMLLDGKILDGRNRRVAVIAARDIEKRYETAYVADYDNEAGSPLDYVLSENVNRRHLSTSQRALVAANVNAWAVGMNQHTEGSENLPTQKAVAGRFRISDRMIRSADAIRKRGHDELMSAVQDGTLKVHAAEGLIELGDKELSDILVRERKEIVQRAKEIRTENKRASRDQKAERINSISAKGGKQMEALPVGKFPIIYCDYPYENEAWSDETGQDRGRPYPTMSVDEIMALCEGDKSPATKDAVLFFWISANRMDDGIDIIRHWGFNFISFYAWNKQLQGTGRWVRDQHEALIIAKRGDFPAPDESLLERSIQSIKRGKTSEKPVKFAEIIDKQFPTLPKLEMFQRKQSLVKGDIRLHRRKEGRWAFWGNESGGEDV